MSARRERDGVTPESREAMLTSCWFIGGELTVTWYQAPERRVQRGDTEGRGFSPNGCSYSRLCVYNGGGGGG